MRKFLSITLSLLLAASAPLSAMAQVYDLAQGSVTVEARADGNQYVSQENGVNGELQTTETIINQTDGETTSTDNTITIKAEKNQTAEVTISDVNIDVSSEGKAAISIRGEGNVTIELEGDNTVKSGSNSAGIEKNRGGNLTITDDDADGTLKAVGGEFGAGIGGGKFWSGSNITITGNAKVEAIGGSHGAGIGGGNLAYGSNITITGNAEVKASGGVAGAGIGGGYSRDGSDIMISGNAKVETVGGSHSAGIGGGLNGNGSDITIRDNAEVIANGNIWAAGIGGGSNANGSDITISDNARVEANGGTGGAGIGGGFQGSGNDVTVSGDAQVKASHGGSASSIGDGQYGNGEITPNTDELTTGSIGYYAPGADKKNPPEKLLHKDSNGTHTHTGVTLKSSTVATCLNNAVVTYLCSCGETVTMEQLSTALGHNVASYTYNNDATCVADGTETGVCSRCKQNVVRTKAGTCDPNKHSLSGYVSNNDATCMADGTKTVRCINAGCTYSVTVPDEGSRNPNKHSFTNYVSDNDVTCFDAGHKTAACDYGCGATDVKIDENAPALGHTFEDYKSDDNATCEQDGTKTAKCVRYGKGGCTATDTVTDTGSKLGHDFKDYVSDGNATCEQDGTKTAKCVRYGKGGCTATDTVTNADSMLGHDFKDYVSDGNATCEQDGTKTAKCVRYGQGGCTATDTVTDVDSKLGHDFTDYIYNDDASYTEDGTETAHCNHAGCTETDTRKAEGTRWSPFRVTDERGWYIAYTESRSGNVLTITVNQSIATLSGTIAGLRVLQLGGIATIIFKTTEAESTFHISDLLAGANYTLTHQATTVTFTLDGNDAANLLK